MVPIITQTSPRRSASRRPRKGDVRLEIRSVKPGWLEFDHFDRLALHQQTSGPLVHAVTLVWDRWGSMGMLRKVWLDLAREVRNPVFSQGSVSKHHRLRRVNVERSPKNPISCDRLAILRRSHDLYAVNDLTISTIHSGKARNQRMIH